MVVYGFTAQVPTADDGNLVTDTYRGHTPVETHRPPPRVRRQVDVVVTGTEGHTRADTRPVHKVVHGVGDGRSADYGRRSWCVHIHPRLFRARDKLKHPHPPHLTVGMDQRSVPAAPVRDPPHWIACAHDTTEHLAVPAGDYAPHFSQGPAVDNRQHVRRLAPERSPCVAPARYSEPGG